MNAFECLWTRVEEGLENLSTELPNQIGNGHVRLFAQLANHGYKLTVVVVADCSKADVRRANALHSISHFQSVTALDAFDEFCEYDSKHFTASQVDYFEDYKLSGAVDSTNSTLRYFPSGGAVFEKKLALYV